MRHIHDENNWDCIVAGSGPAGLGAAVSCARLGGKVLVLEAAGQPGGTICAVPFMPVNRLRVQKEKRSDVHEAFVESLMSFGSEGCYPGPEDAVNGDGFCVHPEFAELAIYRLMEKEGITLRLFSPVIDAVTEDRKIKEIIVREKRGMVHYRAKLYIDATGDGDLAVSAGCSFWEGKSEETMDPSIAIEANFMLRTQNTEEKAVHMPITLGFSLLGIEAEPFFAWMGKNVDTFKEILKKEDAQGRYVASWYAFNHGTSVGVMGVNNGAWIRQKLTSNGLNSSDLTDARRNGVRVAADLAAILRENHIPGCEHCTLDRVGGILGVRDTRRIEGEYVLTFEDSQKSGEFEDTIARKYGAIDANQLFMGKMDSGFAYPYRSLLPAAIDNLILAGRCGSATFLGHTAGKSMGNMMELGCAAGAAAGLCVKEGIIPRKLDIHMLRQTLISTLHVRL